MNDKIAPKAINKYHLLFNSIDEGFCIFTLQFNEKGDAIDWIYTEANPAFEKQTGFSDPVGRRISHLQPDLERSWFERFAEVARTGEPVRFTQYTEAMGIWYDVYALRVGEAHENQVSLLFSDVTERKQKEQHQDFLLKLSDTLRTEKGVKAVGNRATQMIADKLGVERVYLVRLTPNNDTVTVTHEAKRQDLPPLQGTYRSSDFPSAIKEIFERTIVYNDVRTDARLTDLDRLSFFGLGAVGFIATPIRIGNEAMPFAGGAVSAQSRSWTPTDIAMFENAIERTWAAIEIARAEELLLESEEKYRTLFNSIGEGFSLLDIQFDENGAAYDVIIRDVNPAQERIDGVKARIGMRVKQLLPDIEIAWIERYANVARSGQSIEFTDWSAATQRWYEVRASRLGSEGSTLVAAVYNDITERKKIEQTLKENEKRKTFLLQLSDMLTPLSDAAAIQATVTHSLMNFLAVNRCYYGEINGDEIIIQRDARQPGLSSVAGVYDLNMMPDLKPFLLADRPLIVPDVRNMDTLAADLKQFCIDQQIISFINLPIIKNDQLTGRFVLTKAGPRVWTEVEIELAKEVAERTWTAVQRVNVEVALSNSQKRFRSIANLVPDLLWDSEPDGSTNWYNQRWLEYTGQRSEEATGWGWINAIHPDDREDSMIRYNKAVESGGLLTQERRIKRFDGIYRWFVINALPLKNESGRVIKMYGSATDIHDRREVEQALQESEKKLRVLIRSLPGAAVFIVDKDLRYQLAEGEALIQAGLSPTDLVGKTIHEALDNNASEHEKYYMQALAGKDFDIEHQEHSHNYITRGVPLRNHKGEIDSVLSISYDITNRYKAEKALKISEQKYRSIFESIDEGFCIYELIYGNNGVAIDLKWIEVNPAYEKQTGLKNVVGKSHIEIGLKIENNWIEIFDHVVKTGEAARYEEWHESTGRWYSTVSSKIGEMRSKCVAVVFTDVTRSKQEEKIQKYLLKLSETLRFLSEPEEIEQTAGSLLAEALPVNHAYFYNISDEGYTSTEKQDRLENQKANSNNDFLLPHKLLGILCEGECYVVNDINHLGNFSPDEIEMVQRARQVSFVAIPLIYNGKLLSVFIAGKNQAYEWNQTEINATQETARQTWILTEQARAEKLYRQVEAEYTSKLEQTVSKRTSELTRSKNLLQSVFDTSLIGMSVFKALRNEAGEIQDFIIKLVNPTIIERTKRNDLVGKLYLQEYPGILESGLFDAMKRVVESGQLERTEYKYQHEGFDNWFMTMLIKRDDGLVATTLDITQQKEAEKRILEDAAMLKAIADTAPDMLYVIDITELKQVYSNYRIMEITNKSAEEITAMGRKFYEQYIHPDDHSRLFHHISAFADDTTDQTRELSFRLIDTKQQIHWVKARHVIFKRDLSGRATHIMGISQDITGEIELSHKNKTLIDERFSMQKRQQREVFRASSNAQESEKKRIAESLHNGLGQLLYAVKLSFDQCKFYSLKSSSDDLKKIYYKTEKLLADAITETRRISHEITPSIIEDFGLKAAIQEIKNQYSGSIDIKFTFGGFVDTRETADDIAIYRMIQELIANILKHAGATQAQIKLSFDSKTVQLTATDNGRGFKINDSYERGIGLRSLRNKLKALNGSLDIQSELNVGTTVSITFPQ